MNQTPDILHALREKMDDLEKEILSPVLNNEICQIKRQQHFVLERVVTLCEDSHGVLLDLTF
jgi:hypothetical protein